MMNTFYIKRIIKQSCFILLTLLSVSCMSDSINIDPDKVLEEDLNMDNQWGSYLTTLQRRVVPEDVNLFQRTEDLFGNMYSGYFSGTQNWEGGANGTTYAISNEWKDAPFKSAFVEVMSAWNILRQKVDSTSALFGIGEIIKVTAMHKATDIYGPLPYRLFGLVNPVPYDSQEDIYVSFFNELELATQILTEFDQANPHSDAVAEYDLIYNGDIPRWIKFANSLRLRLAIRLSGVYDKAQKEAEAAVNNSYGVIELNDESPVMQTNSSHSFTYHNPIYSISSANGYEEDVMGATMDAYMTGYNDPRLPKYFLPAADGKFRGLRNGHKNGNIFKGDTNLSKPNVTDGTPYKWMNASEVYFLRAEGALRGWNMKGTAGELYKKGIETSFEECGVSGLTEYMNSELKPSKYDGYRSSPSISAPSNCIVKWNENAGFEEKLEKIITQKWIAIYPLGQEAWSEFRRTGYPRIYPIVHNESGGVISSSEQIRRVPFPYSEYMGNKLELIKGIELLNGPDNGATRLWWNKNR